MNTPLASLCSWRAAICALAVTASTALLAQTPIAETTPSTGSAAATPGDVSTHEPLKHTDRTFVQDAAEAGREEVAISRIAAERATSPDVKQFAQMMVDDHTRANDVLASFAQTRNLTLKERHKSLEKWSRKDPRDFDRDYVQQMISEHKKAIKLFSHESQDGSDSDLVDFARKTLPTLNRHLERLNELEKTLK